MPTYTKITKRKRLQDKPFETTTIRREGTRTITKTKRGKVITTKKEDTRTGKTATTVAKDVDGKRVVTEFKDGERVSILGKPVKPKISKVKKIDKLGVRKEEVIQDGKVMIKKELGDDRYSIEPKIIGGVASEKDVSIIDKKTGILTRDYRTPQGARIVETKTPTKFGYDVVKKKYLGEKLVQTSKSQERKEKTKIVSIRDEDIGIKYKPVETTITTPEGKEYKALVKGPEIYPVLGVQQTAAEVTQKYLQAPPVMEYPEAVPIKELIVTPQMSADSKKIAIYNAKVNQYIASGIIGRTPERKKQLDIERDKLIVEMRKKYPQSNPEMAIMTTTDIKLLAGKGLVDTEQIQTLLFTPKEELVKTKEIDIDTSYGPQQAWHVPPVGGIEYEPAKIEKEGPDLVWEDVDKHITYPAYQPGTKYIPKGQDKVTEIIGSEVFGAKTAGEALKYVSTPVEERKIEITESSNLDEAIRAVAMYNQKVNLFNINKLPTASQSDIDILNKEREKIDEVLKDNYGLDTANVLSKPGKTSYSFVEAIDTDYGRLKNKIIYNADYGQISEQFGDLIENKNVFDIRKEKILNEQNALKSSESQKESEWTWYDKNINALNQEREGLDLYNIIAVDKYNKKVEQFDSEYEKRFNKVNFDINKYSEDSEKFNLDVSNLNNKYSDLIQERESYVVSSQAEKEVLDDMKEDIETKYFERKMTLTPTDGGTAIPSWSVERRETLGPGKVRIFGKDFFREDDEKAYMQDKEEYQKMSDEYVKKYAPILKNRYILQYNQDIVDTQTVNPNINLNKVEELRLAVSALEKGDVKVDKSNVDYLTNLIQQTNIPLQKQLRQDTSYQYYPKEYLTKDVEVIKHGGNLVDSATTHMSNFYAKEAAKVAAVAVASYYFPIVATKLIASTATVPILGTAGKVLSTKTSQAALWSLYGVQTGARGYKAYKEKDYLEGAYITAELGGLGAGIAHLKGTWPFKKPISPYFGRPSFSRGKAFEVKTDSDFKIGKMLGGDVSRPQATLYGGLVAPKQATRMRTTGQLERIKTQLGIKGIRFGPDGKIITESIPVTFKLGQARLPERYTVYDKSGRVAGYLEESTFKSGSFLLDKPTLKLTNIEPLAYDLTSTSKTRVFYPVKTVGKDVFIFRDYNWIEFNPQIYGIKSIKSITVGSQAETGHLAVSEIEPPTIPETPEVDLTKKLRYPFQKLTSQLLSPKIKPAEIPVREPVKLKDGEIVTEEGLIIKAKTDVTPSKYDMEQMLGKLSGPGYKRHFEFYPEEPVPRPTKDILKQDVIRPTTTLLPPLTGPEFATGYERKTGLYFVPKYDVSSVQRQEEDIKSKSLLARDFYYDSDVISSMKTESAYTFVPPMLKTTTIQDTDTIGMFDMPSAPIMAVAGIGGVGGISKITKTPSILGGFGSLPRGRGARGIRRGVKEWTIINPLRDLPGEFFARQRVKGQKGISEDVIGKMLGTTSKKKTMKGII